MPAPPARAAVAAARCSKPRVSQVLPFMEKILFVCIHNSARSQIAEALLNRMSGDEFAAESVGLAPGTLNPLAVAVLSEVGIDISAKKTRGVAELIRSGARFDWVITVCDESSARQCPVFPGESQRLHWSLPDPSAFRGSWQERLEQTRAIRSTVESKIRDFLQLAAR